MNERRASTSLTPAAIGLFVAVGLVLVTILVIDTGLYGGSLLSRDGQDLPVNPFQAPFDLVMGKLHWSSSSTLVTACVVLPLLLLVALAVGIRLKRRKMPRVRLVTSAGDELKPQAVFKDRIDFGVPADGQLVLTWE